MINKKSKEDKTINIEIKWGSTATMFLKANRKLISKIIKFDKPTNKEGGEFITTSINPSIQGTMLDTLLSWILNREIVVDKWRMLEMYAMKNYYNKHELKKFAEKYGKFGLKMEFEDLDLFLNEKNCKILLKLAHLSAILTHAYRSGLLNYSIEKFKELNNNKKAYSEEDLKAFKILSKRLEKKANLIRNKNFIDNPLFGGMISKNKMMKADGDYFYENILGDIKSSKYSNFKPEHIYQLMIYFWLNTHKENKLNIEKLEIYNPLWDIEYHIDIKDVDYDFSLLEKSLSY